MPLDTAKDDMPDMMLSRDEARHLVEAGLHARGICQPTAAALARSAVAAECDGLWQQGLIAALSQERLVAQGVVDGQAKPVVSARDTWTLVADAAGGFVMPAIEQGLAQAVDLACQQGHSALSVRGVPCHGAGAMAHHLEQAADRGLIALGFDVAGDGSPVAMALPRGERPSLVIDVSAAGLAQGHILLADAQQQSLPADWAPDDPGYANAEAHAVASATDGRMALVIGLMAAAITEAAGITPSPSDDADLRFMLVDPARLGAAQFDEELDSILALALMDQDRPLPGRRRQRARQRADELGLAISGWLYQALVNLTAEPPSVPEAGPAC